MQGFFPRLACFMTAKLHASRSLFRYLVEHPQMGLIQVLLQLLLELLTHIYL